MFFKRGNKETAMKTFKKANVWYNINFIISKRRMKITFRSIYSGFINGLMILSLLFSCISKIPTSELIK